MDHSPGFLAHVEARTAGVHEVSVEEASAAVAADTAARLFDVREDREYNARHAAGAAHLGRGVIERDIERLVPDKATALYLYCGGGFRSGLASDSLRQMGYTNVHSVAGGWRAWEAASLPTEAGAAARIKVASVTALRAALGVAGVEALVSEVRGDVVSVRADDGTTVEFWQDAEA